MHQLLHKPGEKQILKEKEDKYLQLLFK